MLKQSDLGVVASLRRKTAPARHMDLRHTYLKYPRAQIYSIGGLRNVYAGRSLFGIRRILVMGLCGMAGYPLVVDAGQAIP